MQIQNGNKTKFFLLIILIINFSCNNLSKNNNRNCDRWYSRKYVTSYTVEVVVVLNITIWKWNGPSGSRMKTISYVAWKKFMFNLAYLVIFNIGCTVRSSRRGQRLAWANKNFQKICQLSWNHIYSINAIILQLFYSSDRNRLVLFLQINYST